MARDFDGVGDNVDFGSDASLDNFTVKSVTAWVFISTGASNYDGIITKNGGDDLGWQWAYSTFTPSLQFYHNFNTAGGQWDTTPPTGQWVHLALSFDKSSDTNNPSIWHNAVAQTPTEVGAPSGTAATDSNHPLRLGDLASGTTPFTGRIAHFVYHDAALTDAEVNRARWWGRPFGGVKVYHPLITAKLANEGTATADGTATGTTVVATVAPVQRPGMGTAQ